MILNTVLGRSGLFSAMYIDISGIYWESHGCMAYSWHKIVLLVVKSFFFLGWVEGLSRQISGVTTDDKSGAVKKLARKI